MRHAFHLLAALSVIACAPAINPEMQSATDQQLAAIKASHSEAASTAAAPLDWAVGQWAVYRLVDKLNEPTVERISVVGQEGSAFWLEVETQDYHHHRITKILLDRRPTNTDQAIDAIKKMVQVRDDKKPQAIDFSTPLFAGMKAPLKGIAQSLSAPELTSLTREDVTVAGGTFTGCGKASVSMNLGIGTVGTVPHNFTVWYHPAVPINGLVKNLSDNGHSMELLDYGLTGATSKIP